MAIILNGQRFKNADQASVSPLNRGLLYGQSVFETIAVDDGLPLLLDQHLARLVHGAERLQIPLDAAAMEHDIYALAEDQNLAVLRATACMEAGGRGYRNPSKPTGLRIISLHDYPQHPQHYWLEGINLGLSDLRLGSQSVLAGIKHGNRLEQIIARNAWQEDWQEALLLDQNENVIEATHANIFALKKDTLYTPSLHRAGVAGVMRDYVLSLADKVGVEPQVVSLSESDIDTADALFVTNSVIGLWPVKQFKNQQFNDLSFAHKLLKLLENNGVIPTF